MCFYHIHCPLPKLSQDLILSSLPNQIGVFLFIQANVWVSQTFLSMSVCGLPLESNHLNGVYALRGK